MKFQNPFELFNNNLDKSKKNIEPFDDYEDKAYDIKEDTEDLIDATEDSLKETGGKIEKFEHNYGIGFFILVLITVFVCQICSYGLSFLTTKKSSVEIMENVNKNQFWSINSVICMCIINLAFLWGFLCLYINAIFGVNLNPTKNRNLINLFFIVSILTGVLLLGSHILFLICPSFIEIFENTIGYSFLNMGWDINIGSKDKVTLSEAFSGNLKSRTFPGQLGLGFLITNFKISSEFNNTFLNFIQDVVSDNKNDDGEPINDISIFSDLEGKGAITMDEELKKLINEKKRDERRQNSDDPSYIYDFTSDKTLIPKDHPDATKLEATKNAIEEFKTNTFKLTLAKHLIGNFCWSYFISVIIFVGSMNAFIT